MNVKTVCPPDCPGRYPGCGANCKTFQAHREERLEVYKSRADNIRIGEVLHPYRRVIHRKK